MKICVHSDSNIQCNSDLNVLEAKNPSEKIYLHHPVDENIKALVNDELLLNSSGTGTKLPKGKDIKETEMVFFSPV